MFKFDSKKIIIAVFPFVVLVAAWILSMGLLGSYKSLSVIFVTLPYILAFFAIVLSVWFQHSRAFYAICLLLFTMSVITSDGRLNHKALINGISIVIPIVFIMLAVTEEKGITSKHGLIKGAVVAALTLIVVIDSGTENPVFLNLKQSDLIIRHSGNVESIPNLSFFLFIICLCVLLTRFLLLSSMMDAAFTGATLGCFIILHFTRYRDVSAIFYSAVFLIFVTALFEASYSLAFHDTLTGVLSRRAMEQEMLRLGGKYTIAMVDIDHFKKVNDKYGHQVGDDVLRMVAAMMKKSISGGKTFRYGGEEFAVVFPRKTKADVVEIMDSLRISIENRPLIIRGPNRPKKKPKIKNIYKSGVGSVRVTVSIGIADKDSKAQSAAEVIEAADKALYKAKRNGRNCIVY